MKGEITETTGTAKEHRDRLLALTQREEVQEIIRNAADDEPVVKVMSGRNEYEYVASGLRIILRTGDLARLGISSKAALRRMRIEPATRAKLVKAVSDIIKGTRAVANAYSSASTPHLFLSAADVGFTPRLRLGGNQVYSASDRSLLAALKGSGLYKKSEKFQNRSVRIALLNAAGLASVAGFKSELQRELKQLGFDSEFVGNERSSDTSRAAMEHAIDGIWRDNPDILLAIVPEEPAEDEEDTSVYLNLKSLTVNRGLASQVVYASTLDKRYAMANIVLGVLGKIGNIPFVLAEPLPYADLVVGIDIARERKRRLAGSINATAIARIYFTNGEFVRYVIHDAPLEGETIPQSILQSLFPVSEFNGKRVVIHRDGYFRGAEKQALRSWAQKISATFQLAEVIKSGAPRLYVSGVNGIEQPPKGSVFKLSNTEAFMVSSLPPFADATPQPLHIRTDPPFSVEQAIHSVLSLTLLHYGSLREPRLPVTIHYSDKIAHLALRGIKPKDLEGSVPFWL
jgi:hypothetical protein